MQNVNVLFVQSGTPFYYPSLQMSIYNALQKVVHPATLGSSKGTIKTGISLICNTYYSNIT